MLFHKLRFKVKFPENIVNAKSMFSQNARLEEISGSGLKTSVYPEIKRNIVITQAPLPIQALSEALQDFGDGFKHVPKMRLRN